MISVVIPTCRRPDLLTRCLERLAPGAQSLPASEYEVIVSDDGASTVEQLIRERFPWATWVAGPRRGPAANRNAGARRTTGEWLAFTDDDCVPTSEWLSGFVAGIHDECRVYEGLTTCIDGCPSPLDHTPANPTGGYLWSCNMLIHRATFEAVGGFDEVFPNPYMEDVDLRERLLRAGECFKFVPGAIVDHPPRRRPSGWRMVPMHEHWLYYWYKNGRREFAAPRLLSNLARVRVESVLHRQFGLDTFRAIWSIAVEFAGLLVRLPLWERKYRGRFLSSSAGIPRR